MTRLVFTADRPTVNGIRALPSLKIRKKSLAVLFVMRTPYDRIVI